MCFWLYGQTPSKLGGPNAVPLLMTEGKLRPRDSVRLREFPRVITLQCDSPRSDPKAI